MNWPFEDRRFRAWILGGVVNLTGCSSVEAVPRCGFWIETEISEHIPTVALVRWNLSGTPVASAKLELRAEDGKLVQTIDLPASRDNVSGFPILGMKAESRYSYRIRVNDGQCESEPQEVTTGSVLNLVATGRFEVGSTLTPGYYILCTGYGPSLSIPGRASVVSIIDQDGDPVWWWADTWSSSRATMDWAGRYMYMLALNVSGKAGAMRRVGMDGTGYSEISALSDAHHDFTVTPEGHVVAISHIEKSDAVVDYDPTTRTVTPIVADVSSLYAMGTPEYHANSITYLAEDDTFILGDRYPNLYVKFDRQGELEWQFGGEAPKGPAFAGTGSWIANHGHHWTNDGKMFVFNNTASGTSRVLEFEVDEQNLVARRAREFAVPGVSSLVLGDVQQLPNGNVLATYSVSGRMIEYSPNGEVLANLKFNSPLGYTMYRTSLYGAPAK